MLKVIIEFVVLWLAALCTGTIFTTLVWFNVLYATTQHCKLLSLCLGAATLSAFGLLAYILLGEIKDTLNRIECKKDKAALARYERPLNWPTDEDEEPVFVVAGIDWNPEKNKERFSDKEARSIVFDTEGGFRWE